MINYFKNKWKKIQKTRKEKIKSLISINNALFIENMQENELEEFFYYLFMNNKHMKNSIEIVNNKDHVLNKEMNSYYNNFFKKYRKIDINKSEIIIKDNYQATEQDLDELLKNKIVIGNYGIDYLYIKKNSENNKIFLKNYNSIEDVEKDLALYRNIYESILREVDFMYDIELKKSYVINFEEEYNKMKNMNKINDSLYEKNNSFLESLEENQMELLFEKILKINDNILIMHNDNYHNNKLCNKYYNNFF